MLRLAVAVIGIAALSLTTVGIARHIGLRHRRTTTTPPPVVRSQLPGPGDYTRTIAVDGLSRTYNVHVPPSYQSSHPSPLFLVFHGGTMNGKQMEKTTKFSDAADEHGFIVVYPDALDGHWNDGRSTTASGPDDIAFVKALISELKTLLSIDGKRIYATGASNGGIFSHRLSCDMSTTFAAIAPIIGSMASDYVTHCKPSVPLPTMMIQGTADPYMPFNGGTVGEGQRGSEGGTVESAQSTLKFWATHNGCSSPSDTLLPVVANDGTRVTVRQYASCRNGVTTTLYTVSGGGHNWYPNQAGALAQKLIGLGPTSKNLDVTQTVTDFFLTQSK